MTGVTRRPTGVNTTVAVMSAVVGLTLGTVTSSIGLALGVAGIAGIIAGLIIARAWVVDVGASTLFLGVIVGGLTGTPVAGTVLAAIAVVVSWDLAHTAITLGEQIGREPPTGRLEIVHAVTSVFVAIFTLSVASIVYLVAGGGQPVAALVLLLVASSALTIALSEGRGERRRRLRRRRW